MIELNTRFLEALLYIYVFFFFVTITAPIIILIIINNNNNNIIIIINITNIQSSQLNPIFT